MVNVCGGAQRGSPSSFNLRVTDECRTLLLSLIRGCSLLSVHDQHTRSGCASGLGVPGAGVDLAASPLEGAAVGAGPAGLRTAYVFLIWVTPTPAKKRSSDSTTSIRFNRYSNPTSMYVAQFHALPYSALFPPTFCLDGVKVLEGPLNLNQPSSVAAAAAAFFFLRPMSSASQDSPTLPSSQMQPPMVQHAPWPEHRDVLQSFFSMSNFLNSQLSP
mmetsp:Transcript_48556/g.113976  ORF Transcript_48556/g.113976 Transcript_48556/m.113976 type:complete len:216 (-) Transcript_48556:211-858(-)